MRYEIKIPFIKNDLSLVLNSLRQIRGISEQYKERHIHSIYFDTKDLQLARHNIEGLSKRYKFRIRWYDHQFKKYNYEIKKKDNKLGEKSVYENNGTDFNDVENFYNKKNKYLLANTSKEESFLIKILNLKPIVKVSYLRKYFLHNSGVRLTIDKSIKYEAIGKSLKHYDNYYVLEYKFEKDNYLSAQDLIKNSIFNPRRYSKYIKALSCVNKLVYY